MNSAICFDAAVGEQRPTPVNREQQDGLAFKMALYVLQLSDIHFTTRVGDETSVHDDVRHELVSDIRVLRALVGQPLQAVAVAGDVAFSGKRAEYELAAQWLDQIIDACGCSHTAVLTIPGNHDVNRDLIRKSAKILHRSLRQVRPAQARTELAELMRSGDPLLLDKLHEYQAFAACYGTPFDSPTAPNWVRRFMLSDAAGLDIVGLSTVQICGGDAEDAEGSMFLGECQYVLQRNPSIENIVLMHHPMHWLRDRIDAEPYLTSRAKVLIYGHEHLQAIEKRQTPDGHERLVLASGGVTPEHAADPYTYRYNLLAFEHVRDDTGDFLGVTVYPRIWSRDGTMFKADLDTLNGQEAATFKLRSSQFEQGPLRAAALDAAPTVLPLETAVPCPPPATLRHVFWRHLDWRARIRVLLALGTLAPAPEAPLPQHSEADAIAKAEADDRLPELWDLIKAQLPAGVRYPNPFDWGTS